jgi:DNA-binding NtrC family response regulator
VSDDGASGPHPSALQRAFSVLVVDDEPDTLASFRHLLEGQPEPIRVHTAASGHEALEILGREPVHLIVTGFRMAPMDGLEFLVRARERAPRVPRVMLTAHPDLPRALSALHEGHVSTFFLKPVEPQAVVNVVRRTRAERHAAVERLRSFAASFEEARRARVQAQLAKARIPSRPQKRRSRTGRA